MYRRIVIQAITGKNSSKIAISYLKNNYSKRIEGMASVYDSER
jgi:ribosomal protein S24E